MTVFDPTGRTWLRGISLFAHLSVVQSYLGDQTFLTYGKAYESSSQGKHHGRKKIKETKDE
jgi:hypothetical protein